MSNRVGNNQGGVNALLSSTTQSHSVAPVGGLEGTPTETLIVGSPYANLGAIPLSINIRVGSLASYGASAPYNLAIWNGTAWAALGAVAGSSAAVVTTRTLDATDAGNVREVAANATLTVTPGFAGCIVKVVGGTCSVAFSGGATGNGAATTLTRAAYQIFAIDPNITGAPNAFTVTGA